MADTSKIPYVTVPFADADENKIVDIDFLRGGITPAMTIPTANGGIKFTRNMLNGIGYFATLGGFLDRIGYPYGKERDLGEYFGGYPKGAILISEDDDYVREYVSQIDNNTYPLPSEAADGTYEGNEYWKPTLPPVVDFFPDFTYNFIKSEWLTGEGSIRYSPDRDGWYSFELEFYGEAWPKQVAMDNNLYKATCTATIGGAHELFRLDGRTSISKQGDNGRLIPRSSITMPFRKGVEITFYYTLPKESGYDTHLNIGHWGGPQNDN